LTYEEKSALALAPMNSRTIDLSDMSFFPDTDMDERTLTMYAVDSLEACKVESCSRNQSVKFATTSTNLSILSGHSVLDDDLE